MSNEQQFKSAAEAVKNLVSRPSNDELLELYALYKQATVGDNETKRPGMLNIKERAKWDAWSNQKGTACDSAMENYTNLVDSLKDQYGSKS